MPVFKDTEHIYQVLMPFFNRLKDDPNMGPKVLASGLIIQFSYSQPDAVITIDCPKAEIVQGEPPLKPDVQLTMKADVAHKFWLGKVNLVMALTKREIIAKGPVAKILKLLPIIKDAYGMYRSYLKEIGMDETANV